MSKWTQEMAYHSGATSNLEKEAQRATDEIRGLAGRAEQYKRLYETCLEMLGEIDSLESRLAAAEKVVEALREALEKEAHESWANRESNDMTREDYAAWVLGQALRATEAKATKCEHGCVDGRIYKNVNCMGVQIQPSEPCPSCHPKGE